jgi:hypothetical protein
VSAPGYEIRRPREEPVRISTARASMLFREAQANEAAKLNGDLEAGFTYQSVIGECAVTPVQEDGDE